MAFEFSFDALEAPAPPATPPAASLAPEDVESMVADELAAARAEAEQIRAAAHAQGFAAGHAEAMLIAGAQVQGLREVAAAMQAEASEVADRLEASAVELAVSLAERVVAAALEVRPELVLDAVRHALRGIVERGRVTVLVHPEDLAFVSESMAPLKAEMGGMDHWEVQSERRVPRGGAIVRHALGDVDATLTTKFERAREVVHAAMREAE